jgi:hypothetical protein
MTHTADPVPVRFNAVNTTSTANPLTQTYTCGSGATVLIVFLFYAGGTARSGGAPTYNGVALTQVDTQAKGTTSPEASTEMWYLLDPPTGSALTVSVPNAGGLAMGGTIMSRKAPAGKTTRFDAGDAVDKATGTNPTHALNVGADTFVVACVADGANAWSPTAFTGTAIHNDDWGTWGGSSQLIDHTGAAGSQTMTWTFGTSEDHGVVIASFKEVSSGVLSVTLDDAVLSTTGTLPISGQLSNTLDPITLSSTGTLPVVGQLAATLQDVSLSATGAVAIRGQESVTLDDVTLVSIGGFVIQGQGSPILDNVTLTAIGALSLQGILGVTLNDVVLIATGAGAIVPPAPPVAGQVGGGGGNNRGEFPTRVLVRPQKDVRIPVVEIPVLSRAKLEEDELLVLLES